MCDVVRLCLLCRSQRSSMGSQQQPGEVAVMMLRVEDGIDEKKAGARLRAITISPLANGKPAGGRPCCMGLPETPVTVVVAGSLVLMVSIGIKHVFGLFLEPMSEVTVTIMVVVVMVVVVVSCITEQTCQSQRGVRDGRWDTAA